jgi:hypothetical protein
MEYKMNKINWTKVQTVLGTWARAFVASAIAAYLSGYNDPKYLLNAGLASVLPVILRWLNPHDAFPQPSTK